MMFFGWVVGRETAHPSASISPETLPLLYDNVESGNPRTEWRVYVIGKSPTDGPFSIAMFDYWRVPLPLRHLPPKKPLAIVALQKAQA